MSKQDKYTVQVTQENWKQLKKDGLLKEGRRVWVSSMCKVGRIYKVESDDYRFTLAVGVEYEANGNQATYDWPDFNRGIYVKPKKETNKEPEKVFPYWLDVTEENIGTLIEEGKIKEGSVVKVYDEGKIHNGIVNVVEEDDKHQPLRVICAYDWLWPDVGDIRQVLIDNV